jgi:hypothetical protein
VVPHRSDLQEALDGLGSAYEQQPPVLPSRAAVGREQACETGRVQERQTPQIQHQARRAGAFNAAHLLVERIRVLEVELPPERHAHGIAG